MAKASSCTIEYMLKSVSFRQLLNESFHYFALSYTWGEGTAREPTEEINVDDARFKVSPNLLAALRAIENHALKGAIQEPWCFWIDAICINQNDEVEKSAQVKSMGEIYRGAVEVLIWLGSEVSEDGSEGVMATLEWFQTYHRWKKRPPGFLSSRVGCLSASKQRVERNAKEDLEFLTRRVCELNGMNKEALIALGEYLHLHQILVGSKLKVATITALNTIRSIKKAMLPRTHTWWKNFLRFITRPWFARVWTLQEVILARRATVLCGGRYVNWSVVALTRSVFLKYELIDFGLTHETLGKGSLDLEKSNYVFELQYGPDSGILTLREILLMMHGRNADKPKDFLYGCLGLMERPARLNFIIDYERSDVDVFVKSLQILCRPSGRPSRLDGGHFWAQLMESYMLVPKSRVTGLPSWCPDFSSRPRDQIGSYALGPSVSQKSVDRFQDDSARVQSDLHWFHIKEIPLDHVVRCSLVSAKHYRSYIPPGPDGSHAKQWTMRLLCEHASEWLKAILTMFEPHGDRVSNDWIKTYFFSNDSKPPWGQIQAFAEARELCEIITNTRSIKTLDEAKCTLGLSDKKFHLLTGYLLTAIRTNQGRFFFYTRLGHIGHSPKPVAPLDEICYFPGACYLHVLSPQHVGHTYVTCASVSGLMGDRIAHTKDSEVIWREYVIS